MFIECKVHFLTNQAWYIYHIRQGSICTSIDFRRWVNIQYLYNYMKKKFEHTEYSTVLMNQLKQFVIKITIGELNNIFQIKTEAFYQFPFELIDKNDRIVVFGAGVVGQCYIRQLVLCKYNIISWMDNKTKQIEKGEITSPSRLPEIEFDKILIAISDERSVENVRSQLKKMKIEEKK